MKKLLLSLTLLMVLTSESSGKQFTDCELATLLRQQDVKQIDELICIIKYQSNSTTEKINDSSIDNKGYGIFQIYNQKWCEHGKAGKGCNIDCNKLIDDDILDDIECAKKILEVEDLRAWHAPNCLDQTIENFNHCFT